MDKTKKISKELAMRVGDALGIDWDDVSPDEFHMGMNIEMEHGSKLGNLTNVTGDDLLTTGRIALAHLEELGDYYSRLKDIEGKASKVSAEGHMESLIMEYVREAVREVLSEGEYGGRDVPLNKPMRGDVKKYKAFVKNSKGNVVKVNFGDPNMRIKKSNPERRKSFRARHKCDTAKDKTTPRYWSCRKW